MPSLSAPSTSSGYGAPSRVGLALEGEQPDLGPVAVGDDDARARARQLGERLDRARDVAPLRVGVERLAALEQRVAAERDDDDARHQPAQSPVTSAYSTACSVGRRLAACCQTRDCGPSMTAAATSSPRWAGRQCRNIGVRRARAPSAAASTRYGVERRARRALALGVLAHRDPDVGVDGVARRAPPRAGSSVT